MYSYNEKVDMLLIFGECKRNVKLQFCMPQGGPENPCASMFYNIEKNLRNYREFEKKKRNKPHLSTTADRLLPHLEENSHTSIRAIATETGLSKFCS
ncbi:hypothetical protein ALC53_05880 [Atta colombica]|uniref:Uncharacterized protein n=1 Tax=Atta colombica TaxID=520822 RepID=A0A151I3K1_9HYME|nr:hypothetical protein ALC53_05880 [Atta colombica]